VPYDPLLAPRLAVAVVDVVGILGLPLANPGRPGSAIAQESLKFPSCSIMLSSLSVKLAMPRLAELVGQKRLVSQVSPMNTIQQQEHMNTVPSSGLHYFAADRWSKSPFQADIPLAPWYLAVFAPVVQCPA
jgi:hypothetical protein